MREWAEQQNDVSLCLPFSLSKKKKKPINHVKSYVLPPPSPGMYENNVRLSFSSMRVE